MFRTNPIAPERALLLAELARALEEAQDLIRSLADSGASFVEMLDLLARLEAARAETRRLQLGRFGEDQSHSGPEWSYPMPWDGPQPESCT